MLSHGAESPTTKFSFVVVTHGNSCLQTLPIVIQSWGMTPFAIRPYHPTDLPALYHICLKTGDSGGDATHLYRDPDLLGYLYAAPYAVVEPDLCFVLTYNHKPCGYILGTRDSVAFGEWCEREWFPPLRARYPLPKLGDDSPDGRLWQNIHAGHGVSAEDLAEFVADYPAHLHIDLLPEGQGQGWGRRLIETFLGRLREVGATAVHLGVGLNNRRAIGFYEKLGFQPVRHYPKGIIFGLQLSQPAVPMAAYR